MTCREGIHDCLCSISSRPYNPGRRCQAALGGPFNKSRGLISSSTPASSQSGTLTPQPPCCGLPSSPSFSASSSIQTNHKSFQKRHPTSHLPALCTSTPLIRALSIADHGYLTFPLLSLHLYLLSCFYLSIQKSARGVLNASSHKTCPNT